MPRTLVARLHTPREFDLLIRRKQRNAADFLEVHADRIVDGDALRNTELRLEVKLRVVFIEIFFEVRRLLTDHLSGLCIVYNLHVPVDEALIQHVHRVGGHHLPLQRFDQLAAGERVAVRLAPLQELVHALGAALFFSFNQCCRGLHAAPSLRSLKSSK